MELLAPDGSYRVCEQHWPLLLFEFSGVQSLEQHQQSLQDWNRCFERSQPFVALRWFQDEQSLIHPPDAARQTKAWLQAGAAQAIRESVLAMLNLVPEAAYPAMQQLSVEKVFGVAGGVFANRKQLLDWCQPRLDVAVLSGLQQLLPVA